MRWTRCLTAVLASAALALVAAGAVRAGGRSAPPSGKAGGHAENGAAQVAHLHGQKSSGVECPPELRCQFLPAAYAQNSSSPYDYGNYDLADRPADGLAIRYVVVHDTEEGYDSTLAEFQDSHAYVSAHYVIRSSDGLVTQMVPDQGRRLARRQLVREHALRGDRERGLRDGRRAVVHAEALSLARPADALPGAALRVPAQPRARHRPRPGARAVEPVPGRDALGSGAVLRLGSPDEAGRRSDQAAGRSREPIRSSRSTRPGGRTSRR